MYTHTPAQTYCFDSFWALERATQSKSHWSQWKNSSSLQRALDPAHTTAVKDGELATNNNDIPQRYRKCIFPPKWDFLIFFLIIIIFYFCSCNNKQERIYPVWKFPRWGEEKITLQQLISSLQQKPEHIVGLWCQTQRFQLGRFSPRPYWHKGAQLHGSQQRPSCSCKGGTDGRKERVSCQHPTKINK